MQSTRGGSTSAAHQHSLGSAKHRTVKTSYLQNSGSKSKHSKNVSVGKTTNPVSSAESKKQGSFTHSDLKDELSYQKGALV